MDLLSSIYLAKGDRTSATAVYGKGSPVNLDTEAKEQTSCGNKFLEPSVSAGDSDKTKIEQLLSQYKKSNSSKHTARQAAALIEEMSRALNVPVDNSSGQARKVKIQPHQPPRSWDFASGHVSDDDDANVEDKGWLSA